MTPAIHLTGIRKIFETEEVETHALAEIDLQVERGEFVVISGPSGSGKTTLLSILGLLDVPSAGDYFLNGKSVARLASTARAACRNRDIGYIFQSFNLIGDLTVYENVELPLIYRGVDAGERKQKVVETLERVSMQHRMKHYPPQLSGGQQQRVAVARALVGSPAVLLADEPTGNLDSVNADAVMELLADLHRQGATICMVTHDPQVARRAEKVVELFDGRITSILSSRAESRDLGGRMAR